MKDQWDQRIFEMAQEEKMIYPADLEYKIERRIQYASEKRKKRKGAVLLAASLFLICSITATASVGLFRQRMEEMNQEKLEEYFAQIYQSKLPADYYNRPFTEEEKQRKTLLEQEYEEQGHFPKGEIKLIDEAKEYRGKGVAYLVSAGTFFLPEKALTDEELLQLIDFVHKRDYSLMKINEKLEAGENLNADLYKAWEEQKAGGEEAEGAIGENSEKELMVNYEGKLSVTCLAAGEDKLFLGGYGAIHEMKIEEADSKVFFDEFPDDAQVTCLTTDQEGKIYAAVMDWTVQEEGIAPGSVLPGRTMIYVISQTGEALQVFDLSDCLEGYGGIVQRMAVDSQEFLYLYEEESTIAILDWKREEVFTRVTSDEYHFQQFGGLGRGKDGRVYAAVYSYEGGDREREHRGIAAIDLKEGKLAEIYGDILQEGSLIADLISPGTNTDFILWGYDGGFTYDKGEEKADIVLPAYEVPCQIEGAKVCVLKDGRIVFAACPQRMEKYFDDGRSRWVWMPEDTHFYYCSLSEGGEGEK